MLRLHFCCILTMPPTCLLCADVISEGLKVRREAQEAEEAKQEAETGLVTTAVDGTVSQLGDTKLIDTESVEDASSQGKSKRWHVKYVY